MTVPKQRNLIYDHDNYYLFLKKYHKLNSFVDTLAYWIVGLPVGYILGFNFDLGVQGVWMGLSIALAISAFMLSFRFNFRSKSVKLG